MYIADILNNIYFQSCYNMLWIGVISVDFGGRILEMVPILAVGQSSVHYH